MKDVALNAVIVLGKYILIKGFMIKLFYGNKEF
jgi:hypothetical protein